MPINHFDLLAVLYDRAGQYSVPESLLRALSLSPNDLLLDVGGGTGRVAAALQGMVKGVTVVDVSDGMLRRAASKGLASVRAPSESLPFLSESIDRIIIMDALHHVRDQRQTVNELWRVLAPGGRILIVEPDIRRLLVKLIAIGEKLLLMRSRILNGEEIRSLFTVKVETIFHEYSIFLVAQKVKKIL